MGLIVALPQRTVAEKDVDQITRMKEPDGTTRSRPAKVIPETPMS
jgi:hypothetical protein